MTASLADLKALPVWITYGLQPQPLGQKARKVPYTPGTNRPAKVNDPSSWRTHDEAVADAQRTGRHVGVVLTPELGITLIDIDGQRHHPIIDELNPSYLEESLNGGLHAIVGGRPPDGFTVPAGVEVYPRSGNRGLLLTENIIDGRDTIEDRTALLAKLFPPRTIPQPTTSSVDLSADDQTIIARVRTMTKGRRLFDDGDASDYASGSEADLGLLNCFRSCGASDATQLDRLYRASALSHNPKRQKQWNRDNYRTPTINRALDGTVALWNGWNKPAPSILDLNDDLAAAAPAQSLGFTPGPCADRVAELERQLAAAHATIAAQAETIATLRAVQSSGARIVGNRSLGPPRIIAATLATQFAWRATAETPPGEIDAPPPPGMMRLSVAAGARLAGISPKSAGAHFATLAEQGIIRRTIETRLVSVDPETGEILAQPEFRSVHFVGPAGACALTPAVAVAFAETVATTTTERVEHRGGKQTPRCPDHPEAGVLRETIDRCAACRRELDRDEAPLPTVALEPLAAERSANFADRTHRSTVATVRMRKKSSDHSDGASERRANFANRSRRDAAAVDLLLREPEWLDDAPDPWDSPPQPALFVVPDPPQGSSHFRAD